MLKQKHYVVAALACASCSVPDSPYERAFALQVAAEAAVKRGLKDPSSAVFEDMRFNIPKYTVCGRVNGKNSFGALAGSTEFMFDLGTESVLYRKPIEDRAQFIDCSDAVPRDRLSKDPIT